MNDDDKAPENRASSPVPIVGIGASAGGLEQIRTLLGAIPADTGAAFVVLQHLAPRHKSRLAELLASAGALPAVTVEDGMTLAADRIHVIPAGHGLTIEGDVLRLSRDAAHEDVPTVIDRFFRALAAERTNHAVGVILSGTGSDGALGLKAVVAAGGLALVQDPGEAEYDGMPRAAIRAATTDYTAATADLVSPLLNHLRRNCPRSSTEPTADESLGAFGQALVSDARLDRILALLREHADQNDFSHYKPAMLKRRIQRRMGLGGLTDGEEYQRLLTRDVAERANLAQDFLISVTDFFREADSGDALNDTVLPALLRDRDEEETIRVWVPGCATGEEAYSIAMQLSEAIEASRGDYRFVIFASDVDRRALDTARAGAYPESIAADVSARRLRRFFTKTNGCYQVSRRLRGRVVFALQNVVEDPPYSRLDLISCRNLLIYLKSETQQRLLSLFHFALKDSGYLWLGHSESLGDQPELFAPISKQHRIFRPIGSAPYPDVRFARHGGAPAAVVGPVGPDRADNVEQAARDILLKEHVPAAVLVNRRLDILCSYGPAQDYCALPFGSSSLGLMEMVREALRSHLRALVQRTIREDEANEVRVAHPDEPGQTLKITARPLYSPESVRGLMFVIFESMPQPVASARRGGGGDAEGEIERRLGEELEATRGELNSTIRELEAANEDLKGSNEEILSINEELQSTNEELETSKEELQSLNEELTTVNSELEHKVVELEDAHSDLNNLFAGTQIATLFLDRSLCIKRFTPAVTDLFNLIASDTGRPLRDITRKFDDADLETDANEVIARLSAREREIQAHSGTWYLRRILPYRTRDDAISGVVITFADISDLKRAAIASRESELRLDMAMSAINGGMWEMRLDPEAPDKLPDTLYLSARLKQLLGYADDQFPNSLRAWQQQVVAADRRDFGDVARRRHDGPIEARHYRIRHADGGIRWFASYGTVIRLEGDDAARWIGIDCDITDFKQSDAAARQVRAQLELLAEAVPVMILFVDRDGRVEFTNTAYRDRFGTGGRTDGQGSLAQELGEAAAATLAPHVETALAGRAASCELGLTRADGGEHTLQMSLVPHRIDDEVLGFYILMHDVSARGRRKSDRMQQQSGMLYLQRMATVGEMLGTIAHDVRQPLSAINTYASAITRMLHAAKPAEETVPIVRKIADQVQHANDVIDNTRDFVGKNHRASAAVDLNTLVHRALALTEGMARKMHVQRRLELHTPLPATRCFPVQIEQVIINVIMNAHEAMDSVDRERRVLTLRTGVPDAEHIQLAVTDSGEGIPADKIGAIFEVFYTSKLDGTGMGLALSRTIVESHGGRLWAESEYGHGATFFLQLPVADDGQEDDAPAPR